MVAETEAETETTHADALLRLLDQIEDQLRRAIEDIEATGEGFGRPDVNGAP